jgi:ubiquinone/menaquinone biosynthesis C-methylase UbiE
MIDKNNKYTKMQLSQYNSEAAEWSENNRNPVVGGFDEQNNWEGYKNLFTEIDDPSEKIAIDFGCGPGRNLVKYKDFFKRLDGVDISPINISKAKMYTENNGINNINLYVNNGIDLNVISSEQYDVVMSTICLQHICVYEIRKSYFKEFYRILKNKGIFTAQMGFGNRTANCVEYYDNFYDALATNSACDTKVSSPKQLEDDLLEIGFTNFKYKIDKVGPGDSHQNWIYFSARKYI